MRKSNNLVWYDKYQPKSLKQLSLPAHTKEAFEFFIKSQEIPNLLLYGPPGSGKTTITNIVTKAVPCVVLSLNAAKDRGIGVVRGRITEFSKSKQLAGVTKIVFLDEADGLTPDAQEGLKATIDSVVKNCRFIFCCNDPSKIVEPLVSRCQRFYFDQFPKDNLYPLLSRILRRELVVVPQDALERVVDQFYPDIRSILNNLQLACTGGVFDITRIRSLAIHPQEVLALIRAGELYKIREIFTQCLDFVWLYKLLFTELLRDPSLENKQKADIAYTVAKFLNNDPVSPDREINASACLSEIMLCLGIDPKF